MAIRVGLDASGLMVPDQHGVRLFDELDRLLDGSLETGSIELVVPTAVIEELDRLSTAGGQTGRAASVGYELAHDRCREVSTGQASGDEALVALAEGGAVDIVVTTDRELRKRLLDADVSVLALRGTNKLAITRP